jgi:hypothetical protein
VTASVASTDPDAPWVIARVSVVPADRHRGLPR